MKTGKAITASFVLALSASAIFARMDFNTDGEVISSDITKAQESWGIYVADKQSNIHVSVAEGVSIETGLISVRGENSSMTFLGNNNIALEQLITYSDGSTFNIKDSTLTLSSGISMQPNGSINLVNTHTTVSAGTIHMYEGSEITVDGGTFNSAEKIDYEGSFVLKNGASATFAKEDEYSYNAKFDLTVGAGCEFNSGESLKMNGSITLAAGGKINLGANSRILDTITLVMDESLATGSALDLSGFENSIKFGDETITLSSYVNDMFVVDSNMNRYNVTYDDATGAYYAGSQIPEPSTCAAAFGALALGLAAYARKRW